MTGPTIVVDSRGAGEGKTTTGIYRLLKISQRIIDIPTLLVVPSIKLQEQYQASMPDIIQIDDIINSDNCSNVSAELLQRMQQPSLASGQARVVVITHEAFRRTEIPKTLRAGWSLVLDEVMDPWTYEKITVESTKTWRPNFNFQDLFTWRKPDQVVAGDTEQFYELQVGSIPTDMAFSDSPQWQRLTSLNHRLWIKEPAYQRLCQRESGHVELIISLHQSIFEHWSAVNIAAAAFEHTFLYHWFKIAGFNIQTERKFVKQIRPIRLHTMQLPDGLKWSNRKRTQYPEILNDYHRYVNSKLPKPILAVRNNAESRRLISETRLGHNAHGINDYTAYTSISLETALVVTPTLNEFYVKQIGLTDAQIVTAFSAYTFYQLIMRTALRVKGNTQAVDVAILDYQTVIELANFLDWPVSNTYDHIQTSWVPPNKPNGRPRKANAMSPKERMRQMRERQAKQAKALFDLVKEDIKK